MDTPVLVALISAIAAPVLGGLGWFFVQLLKNKDDQMKRLEVTHGERVADLVGRLVAKTKECESERERADAAEQKYVGVLVADIEERKQRDRTLEVLSRVATRREDSE